ncbi:hypothetical protein [Paludisphaera rhizosphaerae]|uniref:hypothetical protein n=1 Tax=Paludisphaera rhizosphaerae TaxID=2711216 RepID=UPI0013EB8B55|nr:hypothetical protein [Paludisphaera rhizosphaerae]
MSLTNDPDQWPFDDSPDEEVVTLDRIIRDGAPVLLVAHDDDGWQFLDGEHVFEDDGVVVYLGDMIQIDPTLADLSALPIGWHARRATVADEWQMAEGEPEVD